MSQHRSYPDLRRRNAARNYFGEGTDGDVVISADTSLAATQDGDMVVKHYKSLTINAGKTLTTAARCRGLLVYVQGDCIINGTLSMSARGAHANPADAAVTSNTPVAPGDGHAVPADGITLRRLVKGYSLTDEDDDLMWGCGAAAVAAEANQPKVSGNGRVFKIPRVGGAGGAGIAVHTQTANSGNPGGTATNGTGGGGSGNWEGSGYSCAGEVGAGTSGTCFSGGSGSGGAHENGTSTNASPYGGPGSAGSKVNKYGYACSGGNGNPAGVGDTTPGADGTGGLLILIVGGQLMGTGWIVAKGVDSVQGYIGSGGGSGGGVVVVLHAGNNTFSGSIAADGGGSANTAYYGGDSFVSGPGGAGAVIGPHKIDPA